MTDHPRILIPSFDIVSAENVALPEMSKEEKRALQEEFWTQEDARWLRELAYILEGSDPPVPLLAKNLTPLDGATIEEAKENVKKEAQKYLDSVYATGIYSTDPDLVSVEVDPEEPTRMLINYKSPGLFTGRMAFNGMENGPKMQSWSLEPTGVFDGGQDYPDMKALLDTGLPPGEFFNYVTSTYLNGLLPYLKPVRVILLERYRNQPDAEDPADRPITDEEIEATFKAMYHTDLDKFGDDVIFVGETEKYWWVLHLDQDVSDCSVGRAPKEDTDCGGMFRRKTDNFVSGVTREKLDAWVDWHTGKSGDPRVLDSWKPRFEIPVEKLKGWLSF